MAALSIIMLVNWAMAIICEVVLFCLGVSISRGRVDGRERI